VVSKIDLSHLESLLAILACKSTKEDCRASKASNLVGGEGENIHD